MKSETKTVGAYEAKTHFAALLKLVASGKEIVITKRERPIARLMPMAPAQLDRRDVIQRMRDLRARLSPLPKGETVKDLINAGRRL